MYLKSLEISGFKSFAKKTSLSFTTSITAIVGPNGSGKSNIAEAFRFVLGEQSIKSLRGKRGEDLIWNGGGEAGRANRASVKLVFDNSKRLFPGLDFDEVGVERVVHRDNSNEYLLNGSQVRLKDVVELLSRAHIGSSGHHIISQGEADRILSASIRERREMIEDALGLKIYQWQKLESIRKLERTEENMKQVESLRHEVAPHLKFLKKQVEKVEKAQEMRRELVNLYRQYFAAEDFFVKTEKERLEMEMASPKKELAELEQALSKARDILTSSKNKDKKSDKLISLEMTLSELRRDKDVITREFGRIEGELTANRRALEKEKARFLNAESKTVSIKDVEEVVGRIETLGVLEDARKLFGEIMKMLRDFLVSHKDSVDSTLIADLEKDILGLEKEKGGYENKIQALIEKEKKHLTEYSELKNLIDKEKDTNRDAEKEVFKIIARQNELRSVIGSLAAELGVVLRHEENFKKDLGEAGIIIGREATEYLPALSGNSREEQEERRHHIEKIKIRLEDAGGGGADIMKEYQETQERDAFLAKELDDLAKAKTELLTLIDDLDARLDTEFKNGINKINSEFQKFFSLMFGGGRAELVVVKEIRRKKKSDIEELLSSDPSPAPEETESGPEGLDVNINLPRKKIKSLEMLSGGERALSSIALLFAISQVNPPPFVILDETDAALDEANSKKYGDMIESLAKNSELILITHNRETMSRAGVLYGITMGSDGASRLLSIAFEEAVMVAK